MSGINVLIYKLESLEADISLSDFLPNLIWAPGVTAGRLILL